MKKASFFFLLTLLCFAQVLKAQEESKPFVHCIVLDKTYSMIGKDGTTQGTTNIWADVQDYCCGLVDGFLPPSTVLLYTFDSKLYGPDVFVIEREADKTAVKNKVRSVKVDGHNTYSASNLEKVIEYVYENYPDNNKRIYLLTDGIEEQKECTIEEVIKAYSDRVERYDHLFYVDLRDQLSQSNKPCAEQYRKGFGDNPYSGIYKGYPSIVDMSPLFTIIPHEIEEIERQENKFTVTQVLEVRNGVMKSGFSFEASILDESVKDANLLISPSKLFIDSTEVVSGRYRINFVIEKVDNIGLSDCTIPVQLKGCDGEKTLIIEPSSFVIELRKKLLIMMSEKGWED